MINFRTHFLDELAKPIFFKDNKKIKKLSKNKSAKYYIIQRSPGAGMFSNVNYVLNHIIYAKKNKMTPVIDMENFTTIYNERKKIHNTKNAWEYYFYQFSRVNLKKVYKSKDYIISNRKLLKKFFTSLDDNKKIINLLKKLRIKKNILKEVELFKKKNFKKDNKILGVHLRSTSYKKAKNHAFPPSLNIICEEINRLIKKFNYKKIFIVTEDKNYLKFLKKKYPYNLFFYNSFRANKNETFKIYPRRNHRYNLGKEIIIETLLLSSCKGILFTLSNVSTAASILAKNTITLHEINLGYNSSNKYIARWLWYIKKLLPEKFGGLKILNRKQKSVKFY